MRDQLTLGRALAMVGGPRKEAKLNDVRIYRQKPGSADQEMIRVDYTAIKKNKQADIVLQAYDIIEVPEAGMFSSGRIGQTLLGAITGGLSSAMQSTGQIIPTRILY